VGVWEGKPQKDSKPDLKLPIFQLPWPVATRGGGIICGHGYKGVRYYY
jgi:hypothetical protein